MSQESSSKFKTEYEFCPLCERRMNKILFDKGVSCRTCRGLNSDGTKYIPCVTDSTVGIINS